MNIFFDFLQKAESKQKIKIYLSFFLSFCFFITLIIVWVLEYIFNYLPCNLCTQQRIPYYIAFPVMLLVALLLSIDQHKVARFLLWFLVGLMFVSIFLSFRHIAIENYWWSSSCELTSSEFRPASFSLEESLDSFPDLDCRGSETVLGFSLASWNVLASFLYLFFLFLLL